MKYLDLVREQRATLAAERAALLAEIETFGANVADEDKEARSARLSAEAERAGAITARLAAIKAEDAPLAERETELADAAAAAEAAKKAPVFIRKSDPAELDVRTASRQQLIDANLRAVEGKVDERANEVHFEKVLKRHAGDREWAAEMLARSHADYETGFFKMITGRSDQLSREERTALSTVTNANGAYLLPTHLDPTVILTNDGSSNVIRQIARKVTLTDGKVWNGVSSAGVTASFDAELAEVSDDSPTFAAPAVTVHRAQALVQASEQALEDLLGLQGDVLMMFADARDRLEGSVFATGTGSNQPYGIFTALDASSPSVEIVSTTAATIGEVDIHAMYDAVPQRWRGRGSWLMNPIWNLAIKRLGTAVSSAYSGDLTMPVTDRILGRPVYESDDAPETTTTTALDQRIVYGDFSNYLIVDKPGSMTVSFIPHLFNTSNNLPDGRVAWYARWRVGADSVNDAAFSLLMDKTSA